jgi:cytochrome c
MKNFAFGALILLGFQIKGLPAEPVEKLVDRYGCMSCHGMVHTQVGPGFAMVAGRYRTDPKAPDYLAGRIRNGGVGNWGRLVMPNQPRMSADESLQLARWVLSQPVAR